MYKRVLSYLLNYYSLPFKHICTEDAADAVEGRRFGSGVVLHRDIFCSAALVVVLSLVKRGCADCGRFFTFSTVSLEVSGRAVAVVDRVSGCALCGRLGIFGALRADALADCGRVDTLAD